MGYFIPGGGLEEPEMTPEEIELIPEVIENLVEQIINQSEHSPHPMHAVANAIIQLTEHLADYE